MKYYHCTTEHRIYSTFTPVSETPAFLSRHLTVNCKEWAQCNAARVADGWQKATYDRRQQKTAP